MFNKYLLPISIGYFLRNKFFYKKESQSDLNNKQENKKCIFGIEFIKLIHQHINQDILNEIRRILSDTNTKNIINNIEDSISINEFIKLDLFKIKLKDQNYNEWKNETNLKIKEDKFKKIIESKCNLIIKDFNNINFDIFDNSNLIIDDISSIIKVYLDDIYNNVVNKFNKDRNHLICYDSNHKNQKDGCKYLINRLKNIYPIEINNDNTYSVIQQALIKAKRSFDVSLSQIPMNKSCPENINIEFPKLDDETVTILKKIKIETISGQQKLDQKSIEANIQEKRKRLYDLTLKELIYNTNKTIIKLIQEISNKTNNIIYIIFETEKEKNKQEINNNVFYLGIFITFIAIILFVMKN